MLGWGGVGDGGPIMGLIIYNPFFKNMFYIHSKVSRVNSANNSDVVGVCPITELMKQFNLLCM